MRITYFIRDNNKEYNELCNKATIKVFKSNKTYYVGAQWGEHIPSNTVDFINTNPDEVSCYQWHTSKGYHLEEIVVNVPQQNFINDDNQVNNMPVSDGLLDI